MIRKTIFTVFLTVLFACSSSDEETNVAPRVSFITPSENISVVIGDVINIQVNAEDPDGQIDTVYIEFNGENVAQITSIPYEFSFNTAFETPGTYELKAIASDNLGKLTTSETIIVEIEEFVIVPPTVQTIPPTQIGLFGANVRTTLLDYGTFGPDIRGICWGLNPNPVYEATGSNYQIADNTDNNGFNHYELLNIFEPGATYYFRAFATYYDVLGSSESIGVVYGNEVEVTLSSEFYSDTGTFIDERDGEEYAWVKINGITWMAENLRFADCDGYDDPINTAYYGKLPCRTCPDGWAEPTKENYLHLINFLGGNNRAGKYLKSNNPFFWNIENATNETLFSGLPGGLKRQIDIDITEEYVGERAYFRYFYFNEDMGLYYKGYMSLNSGVGAQIYDEEYGTSLYSVSMRCVKIE